MWADRLIRLLYPHRCLLCERVVRGYVAICEDCAERAPLISQKRVCKLCSRPIGDEHFLCRDCMVHPRLFKACFAASTYEGNLRRAILRFKFFSRPDLHRGFARIILTRLAKQSLLPRFDAVVAAPLSRERLAVRGYNQAGLIAKEIARGLRIPYDEQLVIKIRDTKPQSALPYHERLTNLAGAFFVPDKSRAKGKTLLLVDDVFTSGATANEITKTLLRAGAKEVYVAVAAITQINPPPPEKENSSHRKFN